MIYIDGEKSVIQSLIFLYYDLKRIEYIRIHKIYLINTISLLISAYDQGSSIDKTLVWIRLSSSYKYR